MSSFSPDFAVEPNDGITQAELSNFQRLRDYVRRYHNLRDSLAAKLTSGCVIEAGPLTAHLTVTEQRRLSGTALLPILGPECVEDLKARVPPSITRRIEVVRQQV